MEKQETIPTEDVKELIEHYDFGVEINKAELSEAMGYVYDNIVGGHLFGREENVADEVLQIMRTYRDKQRDEILRARSEFFLNKADSITKKVAAAEQTFDDVWLVRSPTGQLVLSFLREFANSKDKRIKDVEDFSSLSAAKQREMVEWLFGNGTESHRGLFRAAKTVLDEITHPWRDEIDERNNLWRIFQRTLRAQYKRAGFEYTEADKYIGQIYFRNKLTEMPFILPVKRFKKGELPDEATLKKPRAEGGYGFDRVLVNIADFKSLDINVLQRYYGVTESQRQKVLLDDLKTANAQRFSICKFVGITEISPGTATSAKVFDLITSAGPTYQSAENEHLTAYAKYGWDTRSFKAALGSFSLDDGEPLVEVLGNSPSGNDF